MNLRSLLALSLIRSNLHRNVFRRQGVTMNLRSLLALSLILPATVTLAADGTFEKTLSLNGAAILSISTGAGYIHVYSGSGNQIHITGHVHSNPGLFGSDADQRVKQIVASPPITQSGNIVTAGPSHADSDLFHNISIDYDVCRLGSLPQHLHRLRRHHARVHNPHGTHRVGKP